MACNLCFWDLDQNQNESPFEKALQGHSQLYWVLPQPVVAQMEPAGKLALPLGRHTGDTVVESRAGVASFSRAMSLVSAALSHSGCSKTWGDVVGAGQRSEGGLGGLKWGGQRPGDEEGSAVVEKAQMEPHRQNLWKLAFDTLVILSFYIFVLFYNEQNFIIRKNLPYL